MRLRRPFVDPSKGPPYGKETYDPAYDLAAENPGTPQFNYVRYTGVAGLAHRWDDLRDFFRQAGRSIGFLCFVGWQVWVFYLALFK